MNPRPSSMWVRCALTLALLSLTACVEEPASGSRPEYSDNGDHEQPLVDVTCFTQDPGCGCLAGTPPIDCTLTEVRGDLVLCEAGASYCVEGVWSECETVESWEMPRPKIISVPGACSPCNPDCFQTNDVPDQADITTPPPGISSSNVQFVNGPPRGIRPIPMMIPAGSIDSDGDGIPNSADSCPTVVGVSRFFGCPTGVGDGGFFHILPPGASGVNPLTFNVQLREADIYILIDRTGSMGDEINNLRTGLTSMISNIRMVIPDTWFGVGRFDDIPDDVYGTSSSNSGRIYRNLLDLTSSVTDAQTAVGNLNTVASGGDWPEANSQALHAMATGSAINLFGTQYLAARGACPTAGRWGYPCFRPNVIPIVILITDAESHNGPTGLLYERNSPSGSGSTALGAGIPNIGDISSLNNTVTYTGTTAGGTNSFPTRCNSTNADTSADRLVQFTVSSTGIFQFDTRNSSYDTYLYLYSGTAPTAGFIVCDDDSGGSRTSSFTRQLEPGTYTLRIDGYSGNTGNFSLNIGRRSTGVSYTDTIAALNARGIRFIGVNSGDSVARADLNSMAADTGSLDANGASFTQTINGNGSGLTNAVTTAVQNLANYSRMDVDVVVQNINILPGVPASALVQSITLGAPGCTARCTGAITNGCSQCLPGTNLPFSVTFRNNVVTPTAVDQVFNFDLIVRGNLGAIELQRVPVRIVVPANAATTTYASGTFSRTFNAADTCDIPPTRPDWGLFNWEVTTPGNSSVVFQVRTGETLAEMNAMTPVSFSIPTNPAIPTAAQYVDIGNLITAAGGRNFLPFLRVTAVLNPSSNGMLAPTLTNMGLQYGCVDSE